MPTTAQVRAQRSREEDALQRRLWSLAGDALDAAPQDSAPRLYVETLNEMIDQQTVRVAALNNRIPGAVLALEVLGAAFAFGLLALYTALHGRGATTVVLAGALVTAAPAGHLRPRSSDAGPDPRSRHAAHGPARRDGAAAGGARAGGMNFLWAALIVAVVTALAVTAMLLVRRRAPEGSYFEDGDRAAGVFGVLATGFAVLLGFVVFLAFESYDTSRSGAEAEAQIVLQQFETAQFLPAAVRGRFSGELVCYARNVVHQEWPRMESGTLSDGYNPWSVAMFRTLKTVEPRSASEQAAYGKWLDQRTDRESARADRTHGAEGVIPTPLWIVLFLSAGDHLRLHALLRRQRRAGGRAGDDDGQRRGRDHLDAAAALVPRQPVPRRSGRPAAVRDGAHRRASRRTTRASPQVASGSRATRAETRC